MNHLWKRNLIVFLILSVVVLSLFGCKRPHERYRDELTEKVNYLLEILNQEIDYIYDELKYFNGTDSFRLYYWTREANKTIEEIKEMDPTSTYYEAHKQLTEALDQAELSVRRLKIATDYDTIDISMVEKSIEARDEANRLFLNAFEVYYEIEEEMEQKLEKQRNQRK